MNAIFKRVSTRKFNDKKIDEEKIELLMRAAMAAPSAHNQQAWEFYVIENKELIKELSLTHKYSKVAETAPLIIVPCYYCDSVAKEFREIDISASVENILLQATDMDLGSLWIGIAPKQDLKDKVRKVLSVPSNLDPFCLIAVGHTDVMREQKDRYDLNKVHRIK